MIRQKIYCDICEYEYGEESPEAEIQKPRNAPAFPQLIWTYFKLGAEIVMDGDKKSKLVHNWQGNANKFELCGEHAGQFNALLKTFAKKDSRVMALLDTIKSEDDLAWDKKQDEINKKFKAIEKQEEKNAGRN